MPSELTCLRVFIASPSGLAEERKAFRDAVQEFNDADAMARGVVFQPLGWEDTLGGIGRPQNIINNDVRRADYFVLVLWDRWGSPPDAASPRFTSGTEEEYHVALECCEKEHTMRQIVLVFKSVNPQQLSDPGPQLQQVLEFRRGIEQGKAHLFHSFDTTASFRKLVHKHLAAWLRHEEKGAPAQELAHLLRVEQGIRVDSPDARHQQMLEPPESPLTAKAWALADAGLLTEAEVEFARGVVGRHSPRLLIEYGYFLHRLGRLDQAAVMFERAIEVAHDQGDQRAVARAYRGLGSLLQTRGSLSGAEQMYRKSLEISERLGHLEGMAADYTSLGAVLQTRGDLGGAEQMYRKSLEIYEPLEHLRGMASNYANLGVVIHVKLRDADGAEQMLRKSLEIYERLGHLEGMAADYSNLGFVLQTRGDLDGAEQMFRKSLEINERLGHLEGIANDYRCLGIVLEARADLDGAEQMYRKSLEIEERLEHLVGMAANYTNLGAVLQTRGDLGGAEQMYRKGLEASERLGHLEGMAADYTSLGAVLQTRGDLGGAEQMYRKSLEIGEHLGCTQLTMRVKQLIHSLRKPLARTTNNE